MDQTSSHFDKEFLFTDEDFDYLSGLAYRFTGINLSHDKRELVYGRLAKRLRLLDIGSFGEYCRLLRSEGSEETSHFINAITTNVTSFFRENHHFEFLANTVIPEIKSRNENTSRPKLRIWSAGCSSGEEPYSIAMVLRENIDNIDDWDIKILATDLDSNVLDRARQAIYPIDRVDSVSMERKKKWMSRGLDSKAGNIRMKPEITSMVHFKQLNLTEPWPIQGSFDCIFFRNVAIYFKRDTQTSILNRLADHLERDGILFVGHSESLIGVSDRYTSVGQTIHRRK